jgi:hypothetical protein
MSHEGANAMAGAAFVGLLGYLCGFGLLFFALGLLIGWLIGLNFGYPRRGIIAGVSGSLLGACLGYAIKGIVTTYMRHSATTWEQVWEITRWDEKYELALVCIGAFTGSFLLPVLVGVVSRAIKRRVTQKTGRQGNNPPL